MGELSLCLVLLANSEGPDDGPVTGDIAFFQVVQEMPSLADQFQKPPSGMMILFVSFEMVGQVRDPLSKQSNLYLGRASVTLVSTKARDYFLFFLRVQGHLLFSFLLSTFNSNEARLSSSRLCESTSLFTHAINKVIEINGHLEHPKST